MKKVFVPMILFFVIFLSACLGVTETREVFLQEEESADAPVEQDSAPDSIEAPPTETAPPPAESGIEADDETLAGAPLPTVSASAPIEVTYFTPPQGEGPYYTVEKPADRDNDLTVLEGAAGAPFGDQLSFSGIVYDANGVPIEGIVIEIWQTDANGVYLHPNDPGTDSRDRNFQFYGEAVTGPDGVYSFRTILPGHYEPRPRHIHVKIKYQGQELLTTQFYFLNDPELSDEAMFNAVGEEGRHLVIELVSAEDDNGNPLLVGERDVILNLDLSN